MGNNLKTVADKIINEYSIVDVIKNYISISKKGKDYKALCPFHADKDPSLSISIERKCFTCFSCQEKGNAISFVMKFKKINFVDAIKEIVKILNIDNLNIDDISDFEYKYNQEQIDMININEKASYIFHRTLFNKENSIGLDYLLKKRKLTLEIIDFYQLGYVPENENRNYLLNIFESTKDESLNRPALILKTGLSYINDKEEYKDFFNNRFIIPIKNENGKIVGFSGRAIDKNEKIKYLNTKTTELFQKEKILFNFCNFDKKTFNEIYLVEGYLDVFAFKKIGIDNVVATMGTALTDNHINLIKKFPNITTIILCYDNDNAGIEATKKAVEKLNKSGFITFVVKQYGEGIKDIDELVNFKDDNYALEKIKNQVSFIQYLVDIIKEKKLSYKDKKIETKKLIDYINSFAFNSLFIDDDIKIISDFSEISYEDIKQMIKHKNYNSYNRKNNLQKSSWNTKKSISEQIFKDYENSGYQLEINEYKQFNLNLNQMQKIKNQEKDLVFLLVFDKQLLNLFFEYLGFISFNNEGNINKILRTILLLLKNNSNIEINLKDFFHSVYELDELSNDEKKYFQIVFKKFIDENKGILFKSEKILNKGIYLILNLLIENYKLRIEKETNIKERDRLKAERDKKIKVLRATIDNIPKK